jgi:hypothetical protein
MKLKAALLCVVMLTLVAALASAAPPAPAVSAPSPMASMTPAASPSCPGNTFSLPTVSQLTPPAQPLGGLVCGSCSFSPCKGAGVNGGCGGLNKCYIYNSCSDNTYQCLCSYGEV